MLTQKIEKYKEVIIQQQYTGNVFQSHQRHTPWVEGRYQPNQPMGKFEFAQYLKTLPMKKGDWIAYKLCATYSKWSCWKVIDIIEIHYMVNEWGTKDSGPRILWVAGWENEHLRNDKGRQNPRLMTASDYKVVKPEEVPPELLEMYADPINQ